MGPVALAAATSANAQTGTNQTLADAAQKQSVMGRPRLEYDLSGFDVGSFRVKPSVEARLAYDDNVFNNNDDRVTDGSLRVSPRVVAKSQWSRHSLELAAGGAFERFAKTKTEDNDQYDVSADAMLDFTRAYLNFGGSYARGVEPRGSVGDIFAVGDRIRFNRSAGYGRVTTEFGRFQLTAGGTFTRYNYLPVRINGTRISQDNRDRRELTATLRGDYRVGPGIRVFLSGTYNDQNYDQDLGGLNQDSTGYAIYGGASFGLTDLLSGEVGIGYLDQHFANPAFENIGGLAYNLRLTWNPTPLMTVTATAARTIQQSPFANQAGILQDSGQITIDHELLRNLILSLSGSVTSNRYRGTDRTDTLYTGEFRIRYLMGRSYEVGLAFNYRKQSTTSVLGRRYSGSSVFGSVTYRP